jgi:hypothetical protein
MKQKLLEIQQILQRIFYINFKTNLIELTF